MANNDDRENSKKSARPIDASIEGDTRGQFAYDGLDRTLHERARLGIMTSLMSHPKGIYFPQLKALCDLTDGNLKRHLDVLCEEGLVAMEKAPVGNRTQTLYKSSPKARLVSCPT